MARDDGRTARLAELFMRRFGSVCDVDEDAEPVHLGDERAATIVKATVVVGPLSALERGDRRIGKGIEAALARELDGAQAQPIERAQHIEIALMVPSRFTPQEH